jgi:hypothetical protein
MIIPKQTLLNFLQDNFGEVKETSSGEFRINSPYQNDTKFHLYINAAKNVFNDFKSGEKGSLITFISEFLQIPKNRVLITMVREYSNRSDLMNFSMPKDEVVKNLELPSGLTFFSEKSGGIIYDIAWNYLEGRGIPRQNILHLGYVYDVASEYDRTIFIPFYENAKIVYFITRDFTGNNFLRYNNPHGINSKEFVFNIDKIEDTVFIFEGVFDALMLDKQVGTAMLSADLGKTQAVKIWNKVPNCIVFVPDNDKTGKSTLEKNIQILLKYKPASVQADILIYEIEDQYKDFGETGKNFIDLNDCKEYNKYSTMLNKLFER